jgi:hypothetical protein
MKPSRTSHPYGLGVTVTPRTVYGVLLKAEGADAPSIVRRFTRSRSQYARVETTATQPASAATPAGELVDGEAMIQFGPDPSATSGADLFLATEFGDLSGALPGGAAAAAKAGEPFDTELNDLLAECRDALHLAPPASVVADRDVSYLVLEAPGADEAKGEKLRKLLVGQVREQLTDFDAECIAFEPMTRSDLGVPRYFATVPSSESAAAESVKAVREGSRGQPPVTRIDSEVPLLIGLVRRAAEDAFASAHECEAEASGDGAALDPPALDVAGRATLVLRAGPEDTLVLAFDGTELCHYGLLSSLTAFDAPETICSRLLLQQDEHGIGEVGRILVLSDHQEDELRHYLRMFFPDARITSVREMLPSGTFEASTGEGDSAFVLAFAAAQRVLAPASGAAGTNLLPAGLARRRLHLPYSWHVYALILLVAATAFFFSGRYVTQEARLTERRAEVSGLAPETAIASAAALQSQIDSVQLATMGYLQALEVLDSLLVGSNRWSLALEGVSAAAKGTPGLWIDNWSHDGGMTLLSLSGTATTRDGVVTFADRVGGDIQSLSFADVRDFPVYSYTLTIPLSRELPEAAAYLRSQALVADLASAGTPSALDSSSEL